MKKVSKLIMLVALALLVCQAASAAGISDADLAAMFPGGKVEQNTILNVPEQGYFGSEIYVRIPYKEKISGAPTEYYVDFKIRKQILDFNREIYEAAVKETLAQFDKGFLHGEPIGWDDAGSESSTIPTTNIVGTTTIDPPQKAAVAGGIVWFQRTTHVVSGRQQVYYRSHYATRVGDFVATLNVTVPDSREKADEWFQKLINACK